MKNIISVFFFIVSFISAEEKLPLKIPNDPQRFSPIFSIIEGQTKPQGLVPMFPISQNMTNKRTKESMSVPSLAQVEQDGFSPRFALFNKAVDILKMFIPAEDIVRTEQASYELKVMEAYVDQCNTFGGTVINSECYQYFPEMVTWNEARSMCQDLGGDLWTPDPTDPFLYHKVFAKMPEVATSKYNSVWMGAKFNGDGFVFRDINGKIITDTFLMSYFQSFCYGYDVGCNCIRLFFGLGLFEPVDFFCGDAPSSFEFVCEYPLNDPNIPLPEIHPLVRKLATFT